MEVPLEFGLEGGIEVPQTLSGGKNIQRCVNQRVYNLLRGQEGLGVGWSHW